MSLEDLPDDCLYKIMLISTVKNIINLSTVNKRFNKLAKETLCIRNPNDEIWDDGVLLKVNETNIHKVPEEYYGNIILRITNIDILLTINTNKINGFRIDIDLYDNTILNFMVNAKYMYFGNLVTYVNNVSMLKNLISLNIASVGNIDINMLTQLKYLNCYNTQITDISNLINLTILKASYSKLVNINHLVNLEVLDIENTEVVNINNLTKLKYLFCNGSNVNNISNLTKLIHLECKYTPISYINNLVNLEYIDIEDTKIDDISNLYNITTIYIKENNFVQLIINNVNVINQLTVIDCTHINSIKVGKTRNIYLEELISLMFIEIPIYWATDFTIISCSKNISISSY